MAPKCVTCPRRVNTGRVTKHRPTQCWYCRQRGRMQAESPVTIEAQIAEHLARIRRERQFTVETGWASPLARIA